MKANNPFSCFWICKLDSRIDLDWWLTANLDLSCINFSSEQIVESHQVLSKSMRRFFSTRRCYEVSSLIKSVQFGSRTIIVIAKISSVNIILNTLMRRTSWKLLLKQVWKSSLSRVLCLPDISNLDTLIIDNNYCNHDPKLWVLMHLFRSIFTPVTLLVLYVWDDKGPDKAKGKIKLSLKRLRDGCKYKKKSKFVA